MTQVIPNGGSRTSQDLYTGQPNELTVDQSNAELRLHDGATAGGHRIPNLDTIDATYQHRNAELDGFVFDPNQKGFLARLAAGVYRLRKWVTDGNITIINADGVGGNPTLGLATTLEGDRKLDGDVIVTGVMEVDGGVNANVAGNLTGDSTGTHTGPTIGDGDFRGHTVKFDNNQIPQSAIAGLAASLAALVFPAGAVTLWSGSVKTIPANWHLCDGTNGTPDLRGRFILGAGADADVGQTGGAATHTHGATVQGGGAHVHAITVDPFQLLVAHMPGHTHLNGVCDNSGGSELFNHGTAPANPTSKDGMANTSGPGTYEGVTTKVGGDTAHAHTASSDSQGTHTHAVAVDPATSLPPYWQLAYIMKIS